MLFYHGGDSVVHRPEVRTHSRPVDFGVGFYTTDILEQAKEWAHRKALLSGNEAIVSVYYADAKKIESLNTHTFRGTSESWLDFVIKYRQGTGSVYSRTPSGFWRGINHHTYDLVVGELADDNTAVAIDAYLSGKRTREWLLNELKSKKKSDQHVFATDKAVNSLQYSFLYYRYNGVWTKNTKR